MLFPSLSGGGGERKGEGGEERCCKEDWGDGGRQRGKRKGEQGEIEKATTYFFSVSCTFKLIHPSHPYGNLMHNNMLVMIARAIQTGT